MQKHAMALAVLAAGLLAASASWAQSTTSTEPTHDFGTVQNWSVYVYPGQDLWTHPDPPPYPLGLSFSLSADADVRIDLRSLGRYFPGFDNAIVNPVLDVYDGSQHLIGAAAVDPSVDTTSHCTVISSFKSDCSQMTALTFATHLTAGTYDLQFMTGSAGFNYTPPIRFGVAIDGAMTSQDYFQALTPTVPEPASIPMMTIGLIALGFARRRSR